jgi:hypothetical protein
MRKETSGAGLTVFVEEFQLLSVFIFVCKWSIKLPLVALIMVKNYRGRT